VPSRIPPVPPINKPRKAHPTNSDGQVIPGYIESLESQAQNNWPAIERFLRNHEDIRNAVGLYSKRPPAKAGGFARQGLARGQ
jgi:hypothetical protein